MCDKRSDLMIRNILLDIRLAFRHFTFDVKFSETFSQFGDLTKTQYKKCTPKKHEQSEKTSVKVTFGGDFFVTFRSWKIFSVTY